MCVEKTTFAFEKDHKLLLLLLFRKGLYNIVMIVFVYLLSL